MKSTLSIAAGLLAANVASAALVGAGNASWSGSPTAYDSGVSQLYSHLLGSSNYYLSPDSNENRYAQAGFLGQISVTGLDRLELFSLGSKAANTNFFGVRVTLGSDSYQLTLTPHSGTSSATKHYFASVNDILAQTGGPSLEFAGLNGGLTTQTALLDFYIYDASRKVTTYASGVGNAAKSPDRPAFDFTPDLLTNPGPSKAKPLPAGKADAISFISDSGFQVWGLEDLPGQRNNPWRMEPDYNDRLFAFRVEKFSLPIAPVPEPSTYGLLGALSLASLIGYRHVRRNR